MLRSKLQPLNTKTQFPWILQQERGNQAHAGSRVAAFFFERATDSGYPAAAPRSGADVLTERRVDVTR